MKYRERDFAHHHFLKRSPSVGEEMSWCAVLVSVCVQCVMGTFPPVSNPPPIPNQGVRTVDISGQRYYVQDDLQINPPQTVVKDESYLPQVPPDPKVDDQR